MKVEGQNNLNGSHPITNGNGGTPPSLSDQEIKDLSSLFTTSVTNLQQNTLPLLLEFAASNPTGKSWKDAFAKFKLNPVKVIEKYNGGTSRIVTAAFAEKMKEKGYAPKIGGALLPYYPSFSYPRPGRRSVKIWEEAKTALQGVARTFLYLKHNGKVLCFKKFCENGTQPVVNYESLSQLKEAMPPISSGNLIEVKDPSQGIKSEAQITFVHTISDGAHQLKVDLLERTIEIRSKKGAKKIAGLLTTPSGKALFNIDHLLENPDKEITVKCDGKIKHLKGSEILSRLLDTVQKQFKLPEDFVENMLLLLKNRDKLVSDVMLSPAKSFYTLWPLYKEVTKIMKKAADTVPGTILRRGLKPQESLEQGQKHLANAVLHLQNNEEAKAKKAFENAKKAFEKCLQECSSCQGIPVSLI